MSRQNIIICFRLNLGEASEKVQNFWNDWQLRVLVLLSLSLQLSLLYCGRRRRYKVEARIHIFLWFCYLVADSVATVALGVISSKLGNSSSHNCTDSGVDDFGVRNDLRAFWAPFMLLHLGGQDTITAYAVQDNDLWLRHLLRLLAQSGVVIYILRTSWKGNWLSILSILMFLAGVIKYAERIWVMRSANRTPKFDGQYDQDDKYGGQDNFPTFRPLFLNKKIGSKFLQHSSKKFRSYDPQTAFKHIEIELGHAYDAFYTKIPLFFTNWGRFFRVISFSFTFSTSVVFLIMEWQKDKQFDLIVTYTLLGGAVLLEIYAGIFLLRSDVGRSGSSIAYCRKLKKELAMRFYRTNKISDALERFVWDKFVKLNSNSRGLSEDYNKYISVDEHAKVEIYQSIIIWHIVTDLCFYIDNDKNVIPPVEIKVGMPPEMDDGINVGIPIMDDEINVDHEKKKMIKEVSDYMMYILVVCPFMLSTGNAEISFEKACELIKKALKNCTDSTMSPSVCETIISYVSKQLKQGKLPDDDFDRTDSLLLYYAVQVAVNLREKKLMWEILTNFWIENLAYVAVLCHGKNHAKQLLKGGEFLTHVWFLIEHLDLEEKFRIPLIVPQQMPAV
uniref:DUF4220 domain-containing protein n=1 Tax=Fagus sylvatica TaxID=28930 RepID=A0A2N9H761_FAGSY